MEWRFVKEIGPKSQRMCSFPHDRGPVGGKGASWPRGVAFMLITDKAGSFPGTYPGEDRAAEEVDWERLLGKGTGYVPLVERCSRSRPEGGRNVPR